MLILFTECDNDTDDGSNQTCGERSSVDIEQGDDCNISENLLFQQFQPLECNNSISEGESKYS